MRYLLLIPALLISTNSFGQTAEFTADSSKLHEHERIYDRIMQMHWIINGQSLKFGSPTIKISPNPNKLDTVLFQLDNNSPWDTIICNIAKPGHYRFTYNECCGSFNIQDITVDDYRSMMNMRASVIYYLSSYDRRTFLGTLGEGGIIVKSKSDKILEPACRSVMLPDIYTLTFEEIEICGESKTCQQEICIINEGQSEPEYITYNTKSKKLQMLYMPLGQTLIIKYNPKTDKFLIR